MDIECRGLEMHFKTRHGSITALQDISFRTHSEEFLCIVGPSGCGKTSLLRIIAGLVQPTAGSVTFPGADGPDWPHCALVFQDHGLFPWKTLLDNVAFGLEMAGLSRAECHARARGFLEKVGLAAFAGNYPHELSQGMRQRANIARAFLAGPEALLMDEPFAALDAQTRLVLQEELLRNLAEARKPVVYVTHDIREAVLLGDRVLVMSGHPGRILEEIHVELPRPRDLMAVQQPEVAALMERIWRVLRDEVRQQLWIKD